MKKLFNKTLRGNRALAGFVALLTTFLVFYSHEVLLSPTHLRELAGPYDGYYGEVAQFQISLERMNGQAMRFSAGIDKNVGTLKKCRDLLASDFNALKTLSSQTDFFRVIDEYHGYIAILSMLMRDIDMDIQMLPRDPGVIQSLAMRFDDIRPIVNDLSSKVRIAEARQREIVFNDFVQKRRLLYFVGMSLWVVFVIWLALNVRRTRKLLETEKQVSAVAHDAMFAKNNFLGMISHELRTPLQTILSSIDLITLKAPSLTGGEVMKRLSAAAEHLEMQLKDLTDLARLDAGKLALHEAPFDPNELIQMVVEDFRPAAERKGLEIVADVESDLRIVVSDAYRIQQIVNNLTSNAIKYTDSGQIHVQVRCIDGPEPQLVITIADTGIGISAEYLPRLFSPFMQIEEGNTRRHEGVGMGLAIVKRLLDLFNGKIDVQTALHAGSRFEVRIPVRPVEGTASESKGMVEIRKRRDNILIVDDHLDIRDSFKDVLEEIGYHCDVLESGTKALKKMEYTRYAAVLLDIQMPELDGFAVANSLRSKPGPNQHVPIIAISAYPSNFSDAERNKIFDDHLSKPIRSDALAEALKKLTL